MDSKFHNAFRVVTVGLMRLQAGEDHTLISGALSPLFALSAVIDRLPDPQNEKSNRKPRRHSNTCRILLAEE